MRLQLHLLASLLVPSHSLQIASARRSRCGPAAVSMNLVKVPVSQADSVLSQAEATGGIIALHVTQPQHFLSNNLVARSAATFASSMLYGGPTCSVIELSIEDGDPDGADALEMCQEKGLTNPLPCVMLFSSDRPVQQCAPAELDETLTALGARSAANKSNQPSRDFGASTGMPSATAVDDIDFTGGGGQTGRPNFIPKFNDQGRTTGDYLPDLVDKPGDALNDDDEKRKRG